MAPIGTVICGLVTGLILGFPPGPAGALCARRSRDEGRKQGALVALGAAGAEWVYALLALALYGLLEDGAAAYRPPLLLAGVVFFLGWGLRGLLWPREDLPPDWEEHTSLEHFGAGLVVGLSAPGALLGFFAAHLLWQLPSTGWEVFLWLAGTAAGCLTGRLALVPLTPRLTLLRAEQLGGGLLCLASLGFLTAALL